MVNEIIHVLGYARKSPDDKKETEQSITNQVDLIEKTCKEKGWNLLDIYIDKNVSGNDRNRVQFLKMINRIKTETNVSLIVVKDQDRFCRDSAFFSDTLQDIEVRGKKVFSIIKNNFLSYEDIGDIMLSVVDQFQGVIKNKKKAEITLKQKQDLCLPPIKPPFGYKFKGNNFKNKRWVFDKKKADKVVEVCSDVINNVHFKDTLARLKISSGIYYRILKNARKGLYSGLIVYTKKIKDSQKKIIMEKEVKYKGTHEPLIDDLIFNKLNPTLNLIK